MNSRNETKAPPKLKKQTNDDINDSVSAWLKSKLPDLTELMARIDMPSDGYSGETFIVEVRNADETPDCVRKYVFRAQLSDAVNAESDFARMMRLLDIMGGLNDLPIPRVLWIETDTSVLGGPFFVMEYIDGKPVPDIPPFTISGWFYDATPQQRKAIYTGCIKFLSNLHGVEPKSHHLEFLLHEGKHTSQTHNHLDRLIAVYDRAMNGKRTTSAQNVIEWLIAEMPSEEKLVVSWGDARPGNILYRDFQPVAALDWEMCTLGDPSLDIAWWINGDKYYLGGGVPRLEGMLQRDEIVSIYESISGKKLANLDYFEVFSAFRFLAIHVHMMSRWEASGQSLFGPDETREDFRTSRLMDQIFEDVLSRS
jgi:aminoglycoside phosphotransferase (APT) family kinase protein